MTRGRPPLLGGRLYSLGTIFVLKHPCFYLVSNQSVILWLGQIGLPFNRVPHVYTRYYVMWLSRRVLQQCQAAGVAPPALVLSRDTLMLRADVTDLAPSQPDGVPGALWTLGVGTG